MAKKTYEKITTPIGRAQYPYLNVPDTKFKEDGEYKVDLMLDKVEDAQFLGDIKARAEKAVEKAKVQLEKKNKHNKIKNLNSYVPYEEIFDDEGETTGAVKVKFKTKAQYSRDDGTVIKMSPDLFDSQGKEIDRDVVDIYAGSKLRCNFTPTSFYSPASNMAGVSLRLNAVQVIELSEGRGEQASSYGFGSVDDGFSVEETDFGSSSSLNDNSKNSDEGDYNFEEGDF